MKRGMIILWVIVFLLAAIKLRANTTEYTVEIVDIEPQILNTQYVKSGNSIDIIFRIKAEEYNESWG